MRELSLLFQTDMKMLFLSSSSFIFLVPDTRRKSAVDTEVEADALGWTWTRRAVLETKVPLCAAWRGGRSPKLLLEGCMLPLVKLA